MEEEWYVFHCILIVVYPKRKEQTIAGLSGWILKLLYYSIGTRSTLVRTVVNFMMSESFSYS